MSMMLHDDDYEDELRWKQHLQEERTKWLASNQSKSQDENKSPADNDDWEPMTMRE